jgi:hypothetical protein
MHNNQKHWVSGLYPSSGILNSYKARFGNWVCFRIQVRGGRKLDVFMSSGECRETPKLMGLERAN